MDLQKFKTNTGSDMWINVEAVVYVKEAGSAGLSTIGLSNGASFVVEGTLDETQKAVTYQDRIIV